MTRCMHCFQIKARVPSTILCADCLAKLMPEKMAEILIPENETRYQETENERLDRENWEALVLLESAPLGLRLCDVPERLQSAVICLHMQGKIRKPRGQKRGRERYFAPIYVAQKQLSA